MVLFKTTTFLRNRNLFNSDFVKELYSLSVHPLLLPPYVGIPLSLNPVIEESPFIWQGYVFLDCLFGKKQGECFSFAGAYLSLLKRIEKKQLRSRQLPNINKTLLPFLLFEYLQVLRIKEYCTRRERTCFTFRMILFSFAPRRNRQGKRPVFTVNFQFGNVLTEGMFLTPNQHAFCLMSGMFFEGRFFFMYNGFERFRVS